MKLCKHEMTRVIADRFVNQTDLEWFDKNFKRTIIDMLGEDIEEYLEGDFYFVDFMK